jgi:hypothetical protein
MVRAMTRMGPVTQRDIACTLAPFVVATLCVAVPLYYLRWISTLPGLICAGVLAYVLFGLCIRLLPGGRAFFEMLIGLRHTLRRSA